MCCSGFWLNHPLQGSILRNSQEGMGSGEGSRYPPVFAGGLLQVIAQIVAGGRRQLPEAAYHFWIKRFDVVPLSRVAPQIIKGFLKRVVLIGRSGIAPRSGPKSLVSTPRMGKYQFPLPEAYGFEAVFGFRVFPAMFTCLGWVDFVFNRSFIAWMAFCLVRRA